MPETVDACLQLSEATLVGLGLPAGSVIASIHERRQKDRGFGKMSREATKLKKRRWDP